MQQSQPVVVREPLIRTNSAVQGRTGGLLSTLKRSQMRSLGMCQDGVAAWPDTAATSAVISKGSVKVISDRNAVTLQRAEGSSIRFCSPYAVDQAPAAPSVAAPAAETPTKISGSKHVVDANKIKIPVFPPCDLWTQWKKELLDSIEIAAPRADFVAMQYMSQMLEPTRNAKADLERYSPSPAFGFVDAEEISWVNFVDQQLAKKLCATKVLPPTAEATTGQP